MRTHCTCAYDLLCHIDTHTHAHTHRWVSAGYFLGEGNAVLLHRVVGAEGAGVVGEGGEREGEGGERERKGEGEGGWRRSDSVGGLVEYLLRPEEKGGRGEGGEVGEGETCCAREAVYHI